MTRGEALAQATAALRAANLADAVREARLLLAAALQLDGAALITGSHLPLTAAEQATFTGWLTRRAAHEPLGRIQGRREFWGLDIHLNEATLEPRPDTETLVEAVLQAFPDRTVPLRLLDVATGSGCILLALLSEYSNATGLGTDKSPRAVAQAAANAARLGFAPRAAFQEADWCAGIPGPFDVIVSNPPYISSVQVEALEANVREYDPRLALDGGADGLVGYRMVIPAAMPLLTPHGLLAVEIGYDQQAAVTALFRQTGFPAPVGVRDLGGVTRVISARLPGPFPSPAPAV